MNKKIANMIDHTILKATATKDDRYEQYTNSENDRSHNTKSYNN